MDCLYVLLTENTKGMNRLEIIMLLGTACLKSLNYNGVTKYRTFSITVFVC